MTTGSSATSLVTPAAAGLGNRGANPARAGAHDGDHVDAVRGVCSPGRGPAKVGRVLVYARGRMLHRRTRIPRTPGVAAHPAGRARSRCRRCSARTVAPPPPADPVTTVRPRGRHPRPHDRRRRARPHARRDRRCSARSRGRSPAAAWSTTTRSTRVVWGRDIAHGTLPGLRRLARPHAAPARDARRRRARAAASAADRGVHGEAARPSCSSARSPRSARSAGSSTASARRGSTRRPARWPPRSCSRARPVLDFGSRAYVDIPYVALVLGALLVETRRPRAGAPVLALLAVAGLLRPEAWLFSRRLPRAGCGAAPRARSPAARRARRRRAGALGARRTSRVTGDPLHSLLGTRDNAQTLERITGLGEVPLDRAAAPGRDPARAGAVRRGGRRDPRALVAARPRAARRAPRASSRSSRSACSPPPGCRSSAATCCCPPRSSRSSAAPARSAGRACRAATPGAGRGRGSALVDARAARRLHARRRSTASRALRHALARQDGIQADLAALVRVPPGAIRAACAPVDRAQPPPGAAARARPRHRPDGDRLRPGAAPAARDVGRRRPTRPSRATTCSTRATSTSGSRRRPPGCGRRAATRRGASSPAAEESGPCTLRRGRPAEARSLTLRPRDPAAPIGDRLRLLPSGPDLVHGPTSREDPEPSTPHSAKPTRRPRPSRGDSASLERIASDRAPLPPRLARSAA